MAVAVADGDVDFLTPEIDQVGGGGDPHLQSRIGVLEGGDAGDQPFGGQGRGGADGQPALLVGAAQTGGGAAQILEGGSDGGEVVAGLLRQGQTAVLADEELDAELVLEPADLMADGGLGDVHLRRGEGEAHEPGGGFECAEAVEGGQQHGWPSLA